MARGGRPVPDVPPYRRMANILFRRRNESAVYFEEPVDVTGTMAWIDAWNRRGGAKLTLFTLLVHAVARSCHAHPRLNRFVSGGRLYQREGVWLSFTVKKTMEPGAPLAVVKRRFEEGETLAALLEDLQARVAGARSDAPSAMDREMALLLRVPHLPLMGLTRAVAAADFFGLLPARFIEGDPFFASAFLTNLGSVGAGAAYHHLYEYGNTPIFCTLGRVADEVVAVDGVPAVRKIARVKVSYDERIEDGFNAVKAIKDVTAALERPERLA